MDRSQQEDILAKLEAWTRQGRRQPVLSELNLILRQSPPRSFLSSLARLANRNHDYLLALQILYPVIRDDRNQVAEASSEDLVVYSKSLLLIGALEEASQCLSRMKEVPGEALLTESSVNFAKWDYPKAISILKKYCRLENLTEYQVLIGKINLLAGLIGLGSFNEAFNLSEELLEILGQNANYQLLYGNCLELRAQIFFCRGRYEEALLTLNIAEQALREQPGRYLLYVNKWISIAKLAIKRDSSEAQELLAGVRREAVESKNWETVRDCDLHLARFTENETLLQRVLLGTPYKGFHDRNRDLFKISLNPSRVLEFCPNNQLLDPTEIDLEEDSIVDYSFLSSTSWTLLQTMTRDIYRPPRTSSVFSELYKEQYFDPFTSPQRVRNAVHRFNCWARENKRLFEIQIVDSEFYFKGPAEVGIRCNRRRKVKPDWQASLDAFKFQNGSRSFKCQEVATFLKVSKPTALKLIQKAIQSGKIRKLDGAKNSRYLFSAGRKAS